MNVSQPPLKLGHEEKLCVRIPSTLETNMSQKLLGYFIHSKNFK